MRVFLVAVMTLSAACGFKASGTGLPIDGPEGIDAAVGDGPPPGDGPHGDAPADAMADAMTDAPMAPQCPATYGSPLIPNPQGSRYRFVATTAAWDVAEADCEDDAVSGQRATHLIVLDDNLELTLMIGGLTSNGNLSNQWAGLTDLNSEGTFRYITPQQITLNLNPGGNADVKDCVRIKNDGSGDARSCTETNTYVCECDGVAADPNRFQDFPNGD